MFFFTLRTDLLTSNNVLIKHIGLFSEATAWLPAHVSMREHGRAVSGGRASPVIMKVKNDQININILIKIAEFAHVLFKQNGDTRGETVTSCASSQIVQSLTNWVERMSFAFSLFVTTVIFEDTFIICRLYP